MYDGRCATIVVVMTQTTTAPGPAAPVRTLYRDPDAGMFAGVCAGLARYTGTDPVIWRITTVVLAVFGGTGAVLYLLGWLLIPKLGADGSVAESWLHRRNRRLSPKLVVAGLIIGAIALGGLDDGRGVAALAVIGAVAYLAYREAHDRPLAPSYPPADNAAPPYAPATDAQAAAAPWAPTREPRPRSALGLVTVSLATLVSGILAWISLAGADSVTPARILAVALLIVGGGLLIGTWYGRARWLIAVGVVLALSLGVAAAVDASGGTLRGGVGERTWVVNQARADQGFRLGVGEATVDLTALTGEGPHVVVHSKVGLGHLIVVVPEGVPIRIHAKARIGDITEFGHSLVNGNHDVERTLSYGPSGDPRVEVEATVGTGQIEVRHG
jgi:phage shock protein PspC (stress-responsive transcriptional regulator)